MLESQWDRKPTDPAIPIVPFVRYLPITWRAQVIDGKMYMEDLAAVRPQRTTIMGPKLMLLETLAAYPGDIPDVDVVFSQWWGKQTDNANSNSRARSPLPVNININIYFVPNLLSKTPPSFSPPPSSPTPSSPTPPSPTSSSTNIPSQPLPTTSSQQKLTTESGWFVTMTSTPEKDAASAFDSTTQRRNNATTQL
jgi:hypothetical protein